MSLTVILKHNLAKRINLTENFKVKLARPELKRTQWQDDADRSRQEEEWPERVHRGTARDMSEHMGGLMLGTF